MDTDFSLPSDQHCTDHAFPTQHHQFALKPALWKSQNHTGTIPKRKILLYNLLGSCKSEFQHLLNLNEYLYSQYPGLCMFAAIVP